MRVGRVTSERVDLSSFLQHSSNTSKPVRLIFIFSDPTSEAP